MYNAAENIEDYISQSQDPQLLRRTLRMIQKIFPNEKLRYFDNGRTFSSISLGRSLFPSPGYEEAGVINVSSQKNHVAIYFYGGEMSWQNKFPKAAVGKGCLRIKNQSFLEKYEAEILEVLQQISLD